jgi:hypothetical protein
MSWEDQAPKVKQVITGQLIRQKEEGREISTGNKA